MSSPGRRAGFPAPGSSTAVGRTRRSCRLAAALLAVAGVAPVLATSPPPPASPAATPAPAPAPAWKLGIGDPLPTIELERLDGGKVTIPRPGEISVINIFASWCGPCRAEMPKLESEIWKELSPRGVVVYGVDRGEPAPLVRSFVERMSISYPVLVDPGKRFFDMVSANGVGIPKTLVIGRDGRVALLENGYFPGQSIPAIRQKLDELLSAGEKTP